ncbi:TetR/AcrR family transcriptional regulator [Stackebrandtia nassauensis]|uniref:HTH tetR-type domain-containing protein n=1 Tax=Stackebrandtia nassauensis (strain DSM 44728 / CIP 108903 / NRRL B-16338 / NBRC 102104 / LLR-40K-21) TaxID=446470 RepID=D3PXU3_STANL|nr:TetR/AcrR family transcriptional regulator [Stackebrandtia nassauensis]ADD43423.1 hypothetical protein Snas_3766 [Stackebrandtia nassauensis DSM 44728]
MADTQAGYRRSTGTPRGNARRDELLELVTDDLAANGLADFSLRRAARAAGTTHKVLLYHFDGAEDVLAQAVRQLRQRRIDKAALTAIAERPTLAERVAEIWPILIGAESAVLSQAMGLAMQDPVRYADLGREATGQYIPVLKSLCPTEWSDERKTGVSQMILATMRGFLMHRRVTGDEEGPETGLAALVRAIEREEAAGE